MLLSREKGNNIYTKFCGEKKLHIHFAVRLAQLVEHLTAEREIAGSFPRVRPILRVLK